MKIDTIKNIQYNISLKNFNTYKIGGTAKYFLELTDIKSLQKAIQIAQKNNIPYFILGGGTNLLVPSNGFNGLIIKISLQKKEMHGTTLYAESGVAMGALVQDAKKHSFSGLEWAAGLPGTLGGAIYGNAGSFGSDIASIVKTVYMYDSVKNIYYDCTKNACIFSYRKSIFKSNKHIILGADIILHKGNIEYIIASMHKNMQYRIVHQPLAGQSEGCVFQNIDTSILKETNNTILDNPDFIDFQNKSFLPAGLVIDKTGLGGLCVGDACVSKIHSNFIVNNGVATSKDIFSLITLVKEKVFAKYNILLKEEIQIL